MNVSVGGRCVSLALKPRGSVNAERLMREIENMFEVDSGADVTTFHIHDPQPPTSSSL